jgi:pimeloyl-ACP methyl ester carboxylesterase
VLAPEQSRFRGPAGDLIAWHEFGDRDGRPVFYCHGFPSSGREAALLDAAARELRLRLIAPDRPGYGGSTPRPARQLADWPTDLAALADHLGLKRFALLGLSGGGPYAVAGAWRLAARLDACTLVCPLGPIYLRDLLAAMNPPARVSLSLARGFPRLAHRLYGGPTPALLTRWPGLVERLRSLGIPPSDHVALAEGNNQAILNSTIADAMAAGALGARQDLLLYTRDWKIPFERIHQPITIWHGDADATVPLAHARWYQAALPAARLEILPHQGHFSVPIHFARRILADLIRAPAERENQPET